MSPTGCGGGNFCPDAFVTRGQMAAFLNRLGALGPGKVPVANATKLDGLDSTQFINGTGSSDAAAIAMAPDSTDYIFTYPDNAFLLAYFCPVDLSSNGTIAFQNRQPTRINMFYDNGLADPVYSSMAPAYSSVNIPANKNGEFLTIQFQGDWIGTVWIFSVHRAEDCHMEAQWIVRK